MTEKGAVTYVWLLEPCDYDSFVTAVYASAESAISDLRSDYGEPYVVQWNPDKWNDDKTEVIVSAHFDGVDHYSTDHNASWAITRWEVLGAPEVLAL